MDIKELLNVFASQREQLESMKYPEGWFLGDEKTILSIQLARTKQRELIMSKTRRDAFLLLSTLKKEQLIAWATSFCGVYYQHKYPTKSSIKVKELRRNMRIEERAVIKRYREEIVLLRKEAKKIKDDRRKGADILHAENRVMKADVFTWLDSQGKFKSIEAAAMAITKQQPIAHVTGRGWYKEWKKLRSASTP